MEFINHNGRITRSGEALFSSSNRVVLYGDGIFESMRWENGKVNWFDDHMERFESGTAALSLVLPAGWDRAWLLTQIRELAEANKAVRCRVRLIAYREGGGRYLPDKHEAGIILELFQAEAPTFNTAGLRLGIYTLNPKAASQLSRFKTLSALPLVMASLWVRQNGFDDCLIINSHGKIIEASSSNIFGVKDGMIFTPSLESGCVDGVMRRQVIRRAAALGWQMAAMPVEVGHLLESEEIFLTNAVSGIRWVGELEGKTYTRKVSRELFDELFP